MFPQAKTPTNSRIN
jgi:hypothetical protein